MDDGSGTVYYRHKTTYETRCVANGVCPQHVRARWLTLAPRVDCCERRQVGPAYRRRSGRAAA